MVSSRWQYAGSWSAHAAGCELGASEGEDGEGEGGGDGRGLGDSGGGLGDSGLDGGGGLGEGGLGGGGLGDGSGLGDGGDGDRSEGEGDKHAPQVTAHSCWTELFFFQAEDGIRSLDVTGVQTCALPI